jgi:hypothetical protein
MTSLSMHRRKEVPQVGRYDDRQMEKGTLVTIVGLTALVCSACGGSPTEPSEPRANSFALRGIVSGYEGAALQGAILAVIDGVNKGKSVVTDAQGRYGFTDLEPGGLTVQASAVDYATTTRPVTLTADTTVDFQLRVLLAQIAAASDTLLFVGNPNGTFSAQGQAINTGDGCAAELTGTANLVDKDLILVATLLWSMPPTQILRPGDRYTYEFCCLTRDQATTAARFNASFRWVTVPCT